MRQGLILLLIGGVIIAAVLNLGVPASTVLLFAFLILCCGGMIFGMRHRR